MAMRSYFQIMDGHFLVTDSCMDFTHVASALYGTALVWQAAQQNPQAPHRPQLHPELQDFLYRMLQRLQFVQSKLNSRAVSSILWSFAKLGQHPDTLMPGIVDGIAQRYIQDIHSATGQSHSSVLLACDQLRLDPCQGTMIAAILQHLNRIRLAQYNAQDLSNIIHGLAKVSQAQPSTQLLNKLCDSFLPLFESRDEAQRPNSQAVANFAWALQQLDHSPTAALASAMIQRMLHLCHRLQSPPKPQEISNLILACSQLKMPITQEQAERLMLHLLKHKQLKPQDLTNTAYALALLGILQQDTFAYLLQRFAAVFTRATPDRDSALRQMYQALSSIQPPSDANPEQYKAWVGTRWALQTLGPKPEPDLCIRRLDPSTHLATPREAD